jgi:hypothetical protein
MNTELTHLLGVLGRTRSFPVDILDLFALFVLLVLLLTVVVGALVLGWLPGHLAAQRRHPQADAIRVCGWLGLLTMGVLLPVAFIWAFTAAPRVRVDPADDSDGSRGTRELADRLAALEQLVGKEGPR